VIRHPNWFWSTIAPHFAEPYLRRAERGLATPAEIEAELVAKGLPPLATSPDPSRFNPMAEVWWTLAMAAAWIIWRTPRAVRYAWGPYRREVRVWDGPHPQMVPVEPESGEPISVQADAQSFVTVEGYTLEALRELPLLYVLMRSTVSDAEECSPLFIGKEVVSGAAARAELWRKLESGELIADGIRCGHKDRAPIRDAEWIELDHFFEEGWATDAIGTHLEKEPRFTGVRVRRSDVLALWPELKVEAAEAPNGTVAPSTPSPSVRAGDMRAAIRNAFAELWPTGVPTGLMVQERDARIIKLLKSRGLRTPSSRTIHRALTTPGGRTG
jgi:hypothetical protein